MNLKKVITIQKFVSGILWGVYIINAFVKWHLYNPFWWVFEIPTSPWLREAILIILFLYLVFFLIMYFIVLDKKGKIDKEFLK